MFLFTVGGNLSHGLLFISSIIYIRIIVTILCDLISDLCSLLDLYTLSSNNIKIQSI